jgi:hypothetical protein
VKRHGTTAIPALLFGLFIFLVLALAQWGSGSSCGWQFPKWFGCVLHDHESLAAGLIGAAAALFAAWIAWTAVQHQLAEQQRQAKRVERAYISGGGARRFLRTEKGDKSGTFPQADFSFTSAIMGRRQDGSRSSAGAFVKKLTFRLASHRTKQNILIAGLIQVDQGFHCGKFRYRTVLPNQQFMGECSIPRSSESTSRPDSSIGFRIRPVIASL